MHKSWIARFIYFFTHGIWQLPTDPARPYRGFFIEASRVLVAASKGFNYDDCFLKSSALSFYTLLSIVPMLAVGFGIAKGFGFQATLEKQFLYQFREYPEVANKVVSFAYNMLHQTEGSVIAGVGVVVLFYTVYKLLNMVEQTLNDIWKVSHGRSFYRKMTDYLATMLLAPILIVSSSSFTIFLTRGLVSATRSLGYFELASPFITFLFYALPYVFAWILFSFAYQVLPNTKVDWKCALIAGIVAGTIYQLLQLVYIASQIGLNSYGPIYGSFAALPLFLVWMNFSWIIFLAGAEIAYHSEYDYQGIGFNPGNENRRQLTSEKSIAILILQKCLQNLSDGNPPLTISQISKNIRINQKITAEVGDDLVECGLLTRASRDYEEIYLPTKNIHDIKLQSVIEGLEGIKEKRYFIYRNKEIDAADEMIAAWSKQTSEMPGNIDLSKG